MVTKYKFDQYEMHYEGKLTKEGLLITGLINGNKYIDIYLSVHDHTFL